MPLVVKMGRHGKQEKIRQAEKEYAHRCGLYRECAQSVGIGAVPAKIQASQNAKEKRKGQHQAARETAKKYPVSGAGDKIAGQETHAEETVSSRHSSYPATQRGGRRQNQIHETR